MQFSGHATCGTLPRPLHTGLRWKTRWVFYHPIGGHPTSTYSPGSSVMVKPRKPDYGCTTCRYLSQPKLSKAGSSASGKCHRTQTGQRKGRAFTLESQGLWRISGDTDMIDQLVIGIILGTAFVFLLLLVIIMTLLYILSPGESLDWHIWYAWYPVKINGRWVWRTTKRCTVPTTAFYKDRADICTRVILKINIYLF